MKNFYMIIILCCCTAISVAQTALNFPNFTTPVSFLCANNSLDTIRGFAEYEAYQTYNNQFDGVRDSNVCIDIRDSVSNGTRIYFDQVDSSKTIFIRCILDSITAFLLDTNDVYTVMFNLYGTANLQLDTSAGCPDNICSGAMMAIQIPDSTGTTVDYRWYRGTVMNYYSGSFGTSAEVHFCGISEKFIGENKIREFIFKITPSAANISGHLDLSYFMIMDEGNSFGMGVNQVRHIDAYQSGPNYNAYLQGFGINTKILIIYNDTTYPDANHLAYVDVDANPNPSTQATVNVYVNGPDILLFQPFAELRGGLVQGSTTLRHNMNLVNNGGTICLPFFIDVLFGNGDNYIHKAGTISFEHPHSCFMFSRGSKLIVDDNAKLDYGHVNGTGMLALKTGGSLEIHKNAELVIHNTLVMYEFNDDPPSQIYMTLNKGSKLTFAKNSRINNSWSKNKAMKLNIYMKGGILDDSGLPEADRLLINRIYDLPSANPDDNLIINGEVNNGILNFTYTVNDSKNLNAGVYSLNGKLISNFEDLANKGWNSFMIDVKKCSHGIYMLKINDGENEVTKKFRVM